MKCCDNCRYSTVGELNQPTIESNTISNGSFSFNMTGSKMVMPEYEMECENEVNWLPTRGNLLMDRNYVCKHWELRDRD
jgi:hypothetical protein